MDKIKLTIGSIITMALLLSGTYYISQDDDAYYCESKDIVMICEKLSSGLGTRCYYEDTYKICSEGWKKIETEIDIEPEEIIQYPMGRKYLCDQEKCEIIK